MSIKAVILLGLWLTKFPSTIPRDKIFRDSERERERMPPKYEKKTLYEHVLTRPGMYIGSVNADEHSRWILAGDFMEKKRILYPEGLLKIFDEILVNSLDQFALDQKNNKIDVTIDKTTIKIENLGCVPVSMHETGVMTPELVFGNLLTSSNYNDDEERTTGGMNGIGAKATNIFSKMFQVEIYDSENCKHYVQVWEENMKIVRKAKITKYSGKKSTLAITFAPDYKRFGLPDGPTDDIVKLMEKRVIDAAAVAPKCKLILNGEPVKVKNLRDYAKLYFNGQESSFATAGNDRWDVLVAPSSIVGGGFQQISFVNGINTSSGGTHVNHVVNQIIDEIGKKFKIPKVQIKNTIFVIVSSTLVNPSFSSQSKTECTSRVGDFGSRFHMTPAFARSCSQILKEDLENQMAVANMKDAAKSDGKKSTRITGVPNLDDANWAGGSKSDQTTLIVTEGLSAKTLAISGLSVVGRDRFGVFPLRGKPRNVRDANAKSLNENAEFTNLKKIIGLQQGKVYTDTKSLRYGRLLIMADADVDGQHIRGLTINMIQHFWPELIRIGFVQCMFTPVVKVGSKEFYSTREFENWLKRNPVGNRNIKYYKGLGTSTAKEGREYFERINKLTIIFEDRPGDSDAMKKAFEKDKKYIEQRKQWLLDYTKSPTKSLEYGTVKMVSMGEFIDREMVQFSVADIRRSIPDIRDGLKPSQRKIIFACIKKNLRSEIKVSQLSGYVSEQSCYHHGEVSLQEAIVNMAQDYMGSNNVNLLMPIGQFGSRLHSGKDHASARYIFTCLSKAAFTIFDARDGPCLNYLEDDGCTIEPESYYPIIPMVLVNGAEGIATGFSTLIPPHNPSDLVENIKLWIKGKPMKNLRPWVKGFKGTTQMGEDEGTHVFKGIYKYDERLRSITVSELPPGCSTTSFKEKLEMLLAKGAIKDYTNQSTDTEVDFSIRGYTGHDVEKDFCLTRSVKSSNMHLITPDGIKLFDSTLEILKEFCEHREKFYGIRKKSLIIRMTHDLKSLTAKFKFIEGIIQKKFIVLGRKKAEVEEDLSRRGFDDFEDLWKIPTSSYTEEKVQSLRNECEKLKIDLDMISAKTSRDLWIEDLGALNLS